MSTRSNLSPDEDTPDGDSPETAVGQSPTSRRMDWSQRFEIIVHAVTAFAAVAALLFAGISSIQARDELKNRNRELNISEQGQVTERFTAATEQLGSETVDVRLGGIYSLRRIMNDSPEDRQVILEVLTAFIHTHATKPKLVASSGVPKAGEDAQAAARIVTARPISKPIDDDFFGPDLSGIYLPGTQLFGANLQYARLQGADLTRTVLASARLEEAQLAGAKLVRVYGLSAELSNADLSKVDAEDANFSGARLTSSLLVKADLKGAVFDAADLQGADLDGANLKGANFFDANLRAASLEGALLEGTDLLRARGITVEQIVSARPTATTKLPLEIAKDARVRARIQAVEHGCR
ncbi:pentapeptide repeat-containing protein [Streptomyces sp. NPDC050803]|uniref:pentapeptide repeat-containing protein n=1 Tax=unclassified Streptomyces TaxID=2593676 RepID=UPI003425FFB0